jgi:hypothetical protein
VGARRELERAKAEAASAAERQEKAWAAKVQAAEAGVASVGKELEDKASLLRQRVEELERSVAVFRGSRRLCSGVLTCKERDGEGEGGRYGELGG